MTEKKKQDTFFCSAASRYFKEDIHASASNYKGFILLEHSDPFPENISDAHFDKEWLKDLQNLAKKKKSKLLLIRNRRTSFRTSRLIFVDCEQKRFTTLLCTPGVLMAVEFEKYINSGKANWDSSPFFLVCTNGKKDKCCAKFGFPVFKFLENHDMGVTVFECTHVGGDRFAANAVLMPAGIYYGRLMVEDVDSLLNATKQNQVYYPNYRGICIRTFFEQAIECYLREFLGDFSADFNFTYNVFEEVEAIIGVKATVGRSVFELTMEKRKIEYPYLLTCKSARAGFITKYILKGITKSATL